jgi:hypothetical protein
MYRGLARVRTAHHVSVDVAAGSDRIQLCGIECLDGGLDLRFEQSVQLEGLPGCDLDNACRMFASYVMRSYPLLSSEEAAGQPQPYHERIKPFEFFFGSFFTAVTIVLLVHAVKFYHSLIVLADGTGDLIAQALDNGAPQSITGFFYLLYWRKVVHVIKSKVKSQKLKVEESLFTVGLIHIFQVSAVFFEREEVVFCFFFSQASLLHDNGA